MLNLKAGASFHNDYGALLVNGKVFRYFRSKKGNKLARMYFRGVHLLFPCHEKYRVTQDCVIIRFPFTEMFEFAEEDTKVTQNTLKQRSAANLDQTASMKLTEGSANLTRDIVSDV